VSTSKLYLKMNPTVKQMLSYCADQLSTTPENFLKSILTAHFTRIKQMRKTFKKILREDMDFAAKQAADGLAAKENESHKEEETSDILEVEQGDGAALCDGAECGSRCEGSKGCEDSTEQCCQDTAGSVD